MAALNGTWTQQHYYNNNNNTTASVVQHSTTNISTSCSHYFKYFQSAFKFNQYFIIFQPVCNFFNLDFFFLTSFYFSNNMYHSIHMFLISISVVLIQLFTSFRKKALPKDLWVIITSVISAVNIDCLSSWNIFFHAVTNTCSEEYKRSTYTKICSHTEHSIHLQLVSSCKCNEYPIPHIYWH